MSTLPCGRYIPAYDDKTCRQYHASDPLEWCPNCTLSEVVELRKQHEAMAKFVCNLWDGYTHDDFYDGWVTRFFEAAKLVKGGELVDWLKEEEAQT